MHLSGRWFGIDFGPFWPGITKAALFLLASAILYQWLGGWAFLINILVWIFGFKIAFNLDWSELWIFTGCFIIGSVLLRFELAMILIS